VSIDLDRQAIGILADNWHQLSHPDGKERRLYEFSQFGRSQQPQDVQEKISLRAQDLAVSALHTLERNGKTVIDKAELDRLKAIAAERSSELNIARAICGHCGTEILRMALNEQNSATLYKQAQVAMSSSAHCCWDE
jgi:hypothetical protein